MAQGVRDTRVYKGPRYFVIGRYSLESAAQDGASGLQSQTKPSRAHRAYVDIPLPPLFSIHLQNGIIRIGLYIGQSSHNSFQMCPW